jgi:SAM-dependent methyltransferase
MKSLSALPLSGQGTASNTILGSRGVNPWLRTQEEWDRWYDRADPWHGEGTDQDMVRKNAIFKRLKCARFTNALDLGCGEGSLTNLLSSMSDKTWGVDISFKAIDRARQRFPHINFLQGDIVDIFDRPEIASTPFDFVAASQVLYYLDVGEERRRTLAGLSRIGTPACLYFFAIVVTGPNSYRAYFTHGEFVQMLSEHFNVIDCFPIELKATRRVKWVSSLVRQRDLRLRLLEIWTNSRDPEACKSAGYFAMKRVPAR